MSYLFRDQSWPQLHEALERKTLLILPVGTIEEHGPHLPVDTDARIAEAYGQGLAEALHHEIPLLLMDTIRYGYSMEIMKKWPGTIVVRSRVFMDYVFDVCRSVLEMGFSRLALLDCHGHHSGALNVVSRELGHVAGLDDLDIASHNLTSQMLEAGIHRTVTESIVDEVFSDRE